MKLPNATIENAWLSEKCGQSVIKWEVLQVDGPAKVQLRFVSKNSPWRQGVWLQCEGGISVAGEVHNNIELWEDTAPSVVEMGLLSEHQMLHFYNMWDRGRGRESQSYTSGMLLETEGALRKYRCNDIGSEPDFSKFIFELVIGPA